MYHEKSVLGEVLRNRKNGEHQGTYMPGRVGSMDACFTLKRPPISRD